MYIEIHVNTSEELTASDKAVLLALAGAEGASVTVAAQAPTATAEDAEEAAPVAKKAPAKKAAAKKAAAAKPEPEPEPEDDDEDLIGGDDEDGDAEEFTMDDAVARATELVSAKKGAAVKAALKSFGAGRVSELKPADIGGFMAELKDA